MPLPAPRSSFHAVNGVRLHLAEAGPADGPLVILLHGFPEFWYGWRDQIGALADAGYHVVAPDQRGYNLSDKPRGAAAYDLDRLAADVIALADAFGAQTFRLIGHDWGGSAAWWAATRHPRRVERLAVLNCPHPVLWRIAMDKDPEQRQASQYVRVLGLPWLPEWVMRRRNHAALVAALRESAAPLSDEDADRYRAAWAQPGALTAMINWYRAILKRRFTSADAAAIDLPVQVIWGLKDKYGTRALAEASLALCRDGRVAWLPEATHWVAHDEPERVNVILLEFLKA